MRFLARILIALGSIAIILGFFLPFYLNSPVTFWDGISTAQAWMFWAVLGLGALSLILMIGSSKAMGLVHLILGGGTLYLIYMILGQPELQQIFGSWGIFQGFIGTLAYGGQLLLGGAAAIFLGGVFELAS